MAVAREDGVSSQTAWFTAPNGNIRRVIMRCFYQADGFLFIDLPMDDTSATGIPTCSGVDENGLTYTSAATGVKVRDIDRSVTKKFMSGWDIGRIATDLGVPREEVNIALGKYQQITGTADLDELREVCWEWASEEKLYDGQSVIRVNGTVLV